MLVQCSWSLLILFLHKCVAGDLACNANETVSGTEGEETILQVNRTGITDISWTLKGQHIATTEPNGTIKRKNRQFITRLGSKAGASLIISKITREDQGVYVADIHGLNEEDDFTQCYNVTVYRRLQYEDIGIHFKAAGDTICNISVTCTGNEGSSVTWIYIYNNITEGPNHTLYIYNVTPDHSFNCSLENPVSKVIRIVDPWMLCNEGKEYKMVLLAVLVSVAIVILCVLIVFYLKKFKTFRSKDRPDGFPVNDPTDFTTETVENPYCEIQEPLEKRKRNTGSAPVQKDIETVYFVLEKSFQPVPIKKPRQQNVFIYDTIKSL